MQKKSIKRKGFVSIEMLLVIGLIVGGLAAVFAVYKNIQANNASMQVTQDIATIVNGLDRFKGATGGYPHNAAIGKINDSNSNAAAGAWNEGNTYVPQDVGSRWEYQTVAASSFDVATGTATGYVMLKTSQASFPSLKKTEIRDILRGKCLNGTAPIEGIANPGKILSDSTLCIVKSSEVLYQ